MRLRVSLSVFAELAGGIRIQGETALACGGLRRMRFREGSLIHIVGFTQDPRVQLAVGREVREVVTRLESPVEFRIAANDVALGPDVKNVNHVYVARAKAGCSFC